jgi:hypothetical protein
MCTWICFLLFLDIEVFRCNVQFLLIFTTEQLQLQLQLQLQQDSISQSLFDYEWCEKKPAVNEGWEVGII